MKYLIIVGDGMADERMPQLGGKSPLEVADIPTINRLARQGVVGHAKNCPPGFSVGSDIAHLSILGCDPSKHFHGRGPMEAAALGFAVEPTDAVFRCNLLTMETGRATDWRRCSTGRTRPRACAFSVRRSRSATGAEKRKI